ncbi:hypothetical protein NC652_019931 [Populus alba x Populus x berolinensis]|nr:hypothetical protein NC652_019931 [Populus alba x Populus x berolinensis]
MLTENEASEEFREGVIKCFRALIEGLSSCGVEGCSCEEINGLPALVEARDNRNVNSARDYLGGEGECLAADNEVARGHRGSAKIRVEAFLTVRALVAKIGTADALAFFLPGVVSQFAKVLHMSKTMISGAAGSVEAIDQAIRALAEYLMIVLEDDANICLHPARKVRQGLLAVIRGLLSKCSCTLKQSKSMFLECLFVLVVDECGDISAPAQEFLDYLLSSSSKLNVQSDVAELFSRLVEKLPKVVFGNDESHALSHAQQLLVVIYYSGPKFLMDHLQSPVTAARFLDIFALSLSHNSVFIGALDKLYVSKAIFNWISSLYCRVEIWFSISSDYQPIVDVVPSDYPNSRDIHGKAIQNPSLSLQDKSELPRMPPWFGSQKLYQTLAGILRLVGFIFNDSEGHMSVVSDIPLGHLRKLVSEIRDKEFTKESWQSWYNRTVSGQLLRQASTAVWKEFKHQMQKGADAQPNTVEHLERTRSIWKVSQERVARSHLNDGVGRIAHEYLSSEVWNLPIDQKSSLIQSDGEVEEITLHFFHDTAMLQQVIIDGIGIFSMCLGRDFASSGFLHSSLYLLLESLICSNIQVRQASDAVLHVLSCASGHPTVGQLVLANADYIIDSICRQLRHLDLNPRVPNVLASLLSYIGVAHKILPLLEEPMRSVSQELEILGRHQHPVLTIPFLKVVFYAVAEIGKASKHEASSLPTNVESYLMHVKSKKNLVLSFKVCLLRKLLVMILIAEQWENLLFKLNDSKRYRRTVGSIAGSCLTAAIPLLASMKQEECLVALKIVEDGIVALAKVEEAYRHEKETKEAIEEAVRRCLSVISSVVLICGGDFFSRRFHTDGPHFWKLLLTSPLQKKPFSKEDRTPLQLPYRSAPTSSGDSMSEISNLKVQVAVLNMDAHLSENKRSTSALQIVLKKVSGLVVGIAFSGVKGLHDASINALRGLASIDSDLIWLLLADVYYTLKKKDLPSPPISG